MKLLALLALCAVAFRLAMLASERLQEWWHDDDSGPYVMAVWWGDLLVVLCLAVAVLCSGPASAQTVPERSALYRLELQRTAATEFGLNAPVARLAAQIHQESAWRPDARSPYAQGLAQFTPATATWIAEVYPALAPADPWDFAWSLRAQAIYMHHLLTRIKGAASECDRWAFALSAYNGGPGWVARDRRLASATGADSARWWNATENHSQRAAWAFKENRAYPRRILLQLEPAYIKAGWPGSAVCPNT